MFFTISRHIPSPTVCVSHFAHFSVFLAIFQVLWYEFITLLVCQFSCHFAGPTACISLFPRFPISRHIPGPRVCISHFALFFYSFLPFSRSYSLCISCSTFFFFSFLAIFQVLECVCLIFLICQFSRHIPGPTVFMYHFRRFSVFSPLSRSYSAYFSFFTFFTVSRHIPGHTCVRFIFQVF